MLAWVLGNVQSPFGLLSDAFGVRILRFPNRRDSPPGSSLEDAWKTFSALRRRATKFQHWKWWRGIVGAKPHDRLTCYNDQAKNTKSYDSNIYTNAFDMGYADLSTRISIRWLPDAASEPTDTLVLNVGSYFMDFRVLKSDISIEWAFAGQREIISQDPLKCRWIHVIDSNGAPAVPDQGSFSKLPNGDDLEVGAMPCAEKNGEVTSYEEIWRVVKPSISPGQPLAWILQSSEDGKVFIGRIGGTYMAMVQTERGFGARREEWESESKKWKGKYAMGEVEGCASLVGGDGSELDGEEGWSVGCKVELKGTEYVVRAWEKLE